MAKDFSDITVADFSNLRLATPSARDVEDAALASMLNVAWACADGEIRILREITPKLLTYDFHLGVHGERHLFQRLSPTRRSEIAKDFLNGSPAKITFPIKHI